MKKIQKLLLLIVFCFPCLFVDADENACTTYKNYYFFNEINDISIIEKNVQANGGKWERNHETYFPNIHGITAEKFGNNDREICLGTEDVCGEEFWTLEEFYNNYKKIMSDGIKGTIKIDTIGMNEEYIVYTFNDEDDKEVSYILHSAWFETNDQGVAITDARKENIDYSSVDTNLLVGGSFIPTKSRPHLYFNEAVNGDEYIEAEISREIVSTDYANVTPFSLKWIATGDSIQSVLTPALYYSEYELCGKEVQTYDAIINYYKKGTTTKVADSWTKSDLSDGYRETVQSPEIKNDKEICEPDYASVDVLIDGEDFESNVYYSCTNNGQTGSAFVWVVLVIAISSLGVGIWYYRKNNI